MTHGGMLSAGKHLWCFFVCLFVGVFVFLHQPDIRKATALAGTSGGLASVLSALEVLEAGKEDRGDVCPVLLSHIHVLLEILFLCVCTTSGASLQVS